MRCNYYMAESITVSNQARQSTYLSTAVGNDMNTMGSKVIARVAEIEFKQGRYEMAVPFTGWALPEEVQCLVWVDGVVLPAHLVILWMYLS